MDVLRSDDGLEVVVLSDLECLLGELDLSCDCVCRSLVSSYIERYVKLDCVCTCLVIRNGQFLSCMPAVAEEAILHREEIGRASCRERV